MVDQLDHRGGVDDRVGVRRHDQRGDTAGGRGTGLAGDIRLAGGTGLAKPCTQIDKSGDDPLAFGVNHPVGGKVIDVAAKPDDAAITNRHIPDGIQVVRRIDQTAIADEDAAHVVSRGVSGWMPSTMVITAMRTAMPLVT